MRIRIRTLRCRRCGHRWVPNKPEVRICARCKSAYWDTPRRNRQGLRPGNRRK